jgi:hypothetical protein
MPSLAEKFIQRKKEPEQLPNEQIEDIVKQYRSGKQFKAKEMLVLYEQAKPKNMLDFRGWKYKLYNKFFPASIILVNMQLTTGQHLQFMVRVRDGGFVFSGGFYIVDDQMKYYNMSAKLWAYDYHEELTFPITRKINVNELKESLLQSDDVQLETAINPVSLQKFLESSIIQKLLAGQELDAAMALMKLLMIVSLIINIVTLVVSLKAAGVFGG